MSDKNEKLEQQAEETAAAEENALEKELQELKEKLKAEEEKYLRLYAEYDNYRKRTQKEKETAYADAQGDVVAAFLAFADDFDMAVKAPCADEGYHSGVLLVQKKLQETFKSLGVEEIATDAGFNPELHNAVMHEDNDELPENTVAEVFRKGYMLKGKVIRHSIVKVVN